MTKDELIAEAKAQGLKLEAKFLGDWHWNTLWLLCGFGIGYLVGYLHLFGGK